MLSIEFGDSHVVWSEANYYYSWHLATKVIFNCVDLVTVLTSRQTREKLQCLYENYFHRPCSVISHTTTTLIKTQQEYFKGTAKKTKTNYLWIVLNYAMWNSLIFDSVFRFRSRFRFRFRIPDSGFCLLVLPPLRRQNRFEHGGRWTCGRCIWDQRDYYVRTGRIAVIQWQ